MPCRHPPPLVMEWGGGSVTHATSITWCILSSITWCILSIPSHTLSSITWHILFTTHTPLHLFALTPLHYPPSHPSPPTPSSILHPPSHPQSTHTHTHSIPLNNCTPGIGWHHSDRSHLLTVNCLGCGVGGVSAIQQRLTPLRRQKPYCTFTHDGCYRVLIEEGESSQVPSTWLNYATGVMSQSGAYWTDKTEHLLLS